jgi:hypothetical protein
MEQYLQYAVYAYVLNDLVCAIVRVDNMQHTNFQSTTSKKRIKITISLLDVSESAN